MRDFYTPAQQVAAFWAKVEVNGPIDCWPWKGARQYTGYGRVKFNGRNEGAHRVAFFLSGTLLPEGLQVLHTCDNRACCNPAHLFAGTARQNTLDCISKNRFKPRGFIKLTESDVLVLRDDFKNGLNRRQIAVKYGISYSHAKRIVAGTKWKHLPT